MLVAVASVIAFATSWRALLPRKAWEDPATVGVNRLPTHSHLVNYPTFNSAEARGQSPNVVSLRCGVFLCSGSFCKAVGVGKNVTVIMWMITYFCQGYIQTLDGLSFVAFVLVVCCTAPLAPRVRVSVSTVTLYHSCWALAFFSFLRILVLVFYRPVSFPLVIFLLH